MTKTLKKSTEQQIEQALLDLLNNDKYGDVYVKDICQKANITHTTFYNHYKNINDLILKTEDTLNESLLKIFNLNENCTLNNFEDLCNFFYAHKNFYRTYFLINQNTLSEINGLFKSNSFFNNQNMQYETLKFTFFVGGLKSLLKQWILLGCKETPKDLAKMIYNEYKLILYKNNAN